MVSAMQAVITKDSQEAYFGTPALSNSGITQIKDCPARFKHGQTAIRRQTDAFLFGGVFHCLALEPEEANKRYLLKKEDGKTKAGKEEKASAESNGLELVKPDMFGSAQSMAKSVIAHKYAGGLIRRATHKETSIYWQESINGHAINCKARLDAILDINSDGITTMALDLKSTQNASPQAIQRDIYKYGYHRQAAWYLRALLAVHGQETSNAFSFVFVEKEPPHIVTPVVMSQDAIAAGDEECQRYMAVYAECMASGEWPAYTNEIIEIDLPELAKNKGVEYE